MCVGAIGSTRRDGLEVSPPVVEAGSYAVRPVSTGEPPHQFHVKHLVWPVQTGANL